MTPKPEMPNPDLISEPTIKLGRKCNIHLSERLCPEDLKELKI